MKVATFHAEITPEIGVRLGGYHFTDVSESKSDELEVNGIIYDNGDTRCAILSFDLIGLDREFIVAIRKAVSAELGIAENQVLLSPTHTHSGPNTCSENEPGFYLERDYMYNLVIPRTVAALKGWEHRLVETDLMHYSLFCDENINRRLQEFDGQVCYLPLHRELDNLNNGFRDQELALLIAFNPNLRQSPYSVLANFAAHPLASHAAGKGSFRISSDYPGFFRKTMLNDCTPHCCFVNGAAGDMFPYEYELGLGAAQRMGEALARSAMLGVVNAKRHVQRCRVKGAAIAGGTITVPVKVRKKGAPGCLIHQDYVGQNEVSLEIQAIAIGDIAMVGVPGEMLAELGQEIKWHSPFRKTFIFYNATDSFDYLCHGNAMLGGGYEIGRQQMNSRGGLALVNGAVDLLYRLRKKVDPEALEKLL